MLSEKKVQVLLNDLLELRASQSETNRFDRTMQAEISAQISLLNRILDPKQKVLNEMEEWVFLYQQL